MDPALDRRNQGPYSLLGQLRARMTMRHMSKRSIEAYVSWVRRFVIYHQKRHPAQLREPAVLQFLTHLAVESKVSASTQNQALAALQFLYAHLLGAPLSAGYDSWRR
jgi:site-specific recombinase XerD